MPGIKVPEPPLLELESLVGEAGLVPGLTAQNWNLNSLEIIWRVASHYMLSIPRIYSVIGEINTVCGWDSYGQYPKSQSLTCP